MIFKLGSIQIPLTGETDNFDGTMMLSKNELALTNSMIQVRNKAELSAYVYNSCLFVRYGITKKTYIKNLTKMTEMVFSSSMICIYIG